MMDLPATKIWWSEEDGVYLCSIPCEWHVGGRVMGHGDSEQAALINAKDAQIATLESVALDYDALIRSAPFAAARGLEFLEKAGKLRESMKD
jgi:predicted RNase H-like HicB family nuclease